MIPYTPNYCRSKYLKGNMYNESKPNEQKIAFHEARTVRTLDKNKKRDFTFPRYDNNKYQYVQGILVNTRP